MTTEVVSELVLTPLQMQQALVIMKDEIVALFKHMNEMTDRVNEITNVLAPIAEIMGDAMQDAMRQYEEQKSAPTGKDNPMRPGAYL